MRAASFLLLTPARTTGGSQVGPEQPLWHSWKSTELAMQMPSPTALPFLPTLPGERGTIWLTEEEVWKFGSLTARWDKLWGIHVTPSFLRGIKENSPPCIFARNFTLAWFLPLLCPACPTPSQVCTRSPSLINHSCTNTSLGSCFWKTELRQQLLKLKCTHLGDANRRGYQNVPSI